MTICETNLEPHYSCYSANLEKASIVLVPSLHLQVRQDSLRIPDTEFHRWFQ